MMLYREATAHLAKQTQYIKFDQLFSKLIKFNLQAKDLPILLISPANFFP
ncbi:hypothetical protein ACFFOO_04975 [Mucilaginibacter ginsenosidivorans]